MESKTIIAAKKDRVLTITLNRPDKLNAVTNEMAVDLMQLIKQAQEDSGVGAVVFTGAGRGFCSGADVAMLGAATSETTVVDRLELAKSSAERILAIRSMPKPTVASVNGVAIGLGLGLALACDIIIASQNARFGAGFVTLGRAPDNGVTYFLPQRAGMGKACDLLFTGRIIDAEEAAKIGLVDRLVSHEQLASATRDLAVTLAKQAPVAVRMTKAALYRALTMDLPNVLDLEAKVQAIVATTEDAREALTAFLEKRQPLFGQTKKEA